MSYKRSSFLKLLKEKWGCEIKPVLDTNVLLIKYGSASSRMWLDGKDRIRYEEIYLHYLKLGLPDLPGEKDLEIID